MGDAAQDRAEAAKLPEGDVIRLLLEQHARIRDLFTEVKTTHGSQRKEAFAELRALLAVHETAEEMILRPVTKQLAGQDFVEARNHEEDEAVKALAYLESLDLDDPEFTTKFAQFETAVDKHAEAEEHGEFPEIIEGITEERRQALGRLVKAAEATAPTHAHPSLEAGSLKQRVGGPFAAIVDRARDAIAKAS